MASKRIVMVGTHRDTMGGISSVVGVYEQAGLFSRQPIEYLVTHRDGGAAAKATVALQAWLRLVGMIARRRVALLHVHMSHRASCWRKLAFIWPAYAAGIPVIIHLHGSEFAEFYERECRPWQQRLISRTFDRAARVLVLSESWRRWVCGITGNPAVITLHNPVTVPARAARADDRQPGRLLFLGRLGQRKGTYDLLAALEQCEQASLWLCGDGEIDACKERVRTLGIEERVQFLGWVRGDDKARLLREASVYVLPSYREGLPMSVLEAMAAGLPVVSTRIGGIPEAVTDGVEGYLIDAGDTLALADRLHRLSSAPQHAAAMGQAAYTRVRTEFSSEVIVPRLEALYAELTPTT